MPIDAKPDATAGGGKLNPEHLKALMLRKVGPFPVWAWALILAGGAVGAILLTRFFSGGTAGPGGDGGSFPGLSGGGGGGGGDGSTTAPPGPTVAPEPALNGPVGAIPTPSPVGPAATQPPYVPHFVGDVPWSPPQPEPIREEHTINQDRWYEEADTAPAPDEMPPNNVNAAPGPQPSPPKPAPTPAPKPAPKPPAGSGTQKR